MNIVIRVRPSVANGKSVQPVVCLRPPSIQNGEVQSSVQHYLLTACSRSFQRPPRSVQPDVDALHQMSADIDVVVFDKDKPVGKPMIAHQLGNLTQHILA